MTIRSTRNGAAIVGGAAAGWAILIVTCALLLRTPALLLLVALLVPVELIPIFMLLRPATVSVEGGDLVSRFGRGQTRVPISQIAGSTLNSRGWTFSDSSGKPLLSLSAIRFSGAEVVDFCAKAGINLSARSQRPIDKLQRSLGSGRSHRRFGVALSIVFLATIGWAAYAQYSARDSLQRYLAAPACTQAPPTTATCRLQAQAKVNSLDSHSGGQTLHLTLINEGGDYIAWLDNPVPNVGDVVEVEMWAGKVVRINGRRSGFDPNSSPSLNLGGIIAVLSLFALICMGTAVVGQYQLVRARAGLRAAGTT
jgi:hypothetical protein